MDMQYHDHLGGFLELLQNLLKKSRRFFLPLSHKGPDLFSTVFLFFLLTSINCPSELDTTRAKDPGEEAGAEGKESTSLFSCCILTALSLMDMRANCYAFRAG